MGSPLSTPILCSAETIHALQVLVFLRIAENWRFHEVFVPADLICRLFIMLLNATILSVNDS